MPSLSLASSPSALAAATLVHKATTELLVGPDWTINMKICDFCNSSPRAAKDVIKATRKRLREKNAKVQLLTLTLLETIVKNCGDYIHKPIDERKLLDEMIKLVKKKSDVHVRDKILVLLDSWEEAFGGPGGRYSQYYWACDELRRCGIQFFQRARSTALMTPPVTHSVRGAEVDFRIQASSRRLDENTGSEAEYLSNAILESMCNVVELLDSMLQNVNPKDHTIVKNEVIKGIADSCRLNQKKLLKMLTVTRDGDLLPQALEVNYSMQKVLEKHDAMTMGAYASNIKKSHGSPPSESAEFNLKADNIRVENSSSKDIVMRNADEEGAQEDEICQLPERCSKASTPSQSALIGTTEDCASSIGSTSNALVLIDVQSPACEPAIVDNTKEQDLIDLLSIVLTTSTTSSGTPQVSNSSFPSEPNCETSLNSYVVPWAHTQQQPFQSQHQFQTQHQNMHSFLQPPLQQSYSQYSSYTLPSWELAGSNYQNPHYLRNPHIPTQGMWRSQHNGNSSQNQQYVHHSMYLTTHAVVNPSPPTQGIHLLPQQANPLQSQLVFSQVALSPQNDNLLLERASNGASLNGNALMTTGFNLIPGGRMHDVNPRGLF